MKVEILQLISQYLRKNHPEISTNLPVDLDGSFSGQKLRETVLKGGWDEILERMGGQPGLELPRFKIIEQKIQEKLADGNQKEALEILRRDLSPLNIFPDRIHRLAQDILLMTADPRDRGDFSEELFSDLKSVPGLMVDEDRLEELIEQAGKYQQMKCPYHCKSNQEDSIWYDHKCPLDAPIVLFPEDVGRKRIKLNEKCPGDIFVLLSNAPDYSNLIVINEDGKIASLHRSSSGNWTEISEADNIGDMKPINIWPKCIKTDGLLNIKEVGNASVSENMMALAFISDDDDRNFAIISTEDQWTIFYDLSEDRVIHSWTRLRCSHLLTPKGFDEKYFLAISDNGNVLQISTETFEVIKTIPAMDEKLQVSSAYLDGRRLLLGYSNSTIYYFDDWMSYGYPTRIFKGHQCTKYRISSILSRYHENIVISCSENGSIYVWNLETGRLIYQIKLQNEEFPVNDVIEIDAKTFVTCGDDNELYEWTIDF